jgi:hypothetical protein
MTMELLAATQAGEISPRRTRKPISMQSIRSNPLRQSFWVSFCRGRQIDGAGGMGKHSKKV